MKPIQEFLSELAALDVKLSVEEASLRCNAPQGILTSEVRAQLSDHKAEIIKFLQDSHLQLIPRNPRNDGQFPLSWTQEGLWFLNQLEGSSATYNMPRALRINGNLDINALEQALSEIVRRHEVLRTSFQTVNGIPIQVIHPEATLNIKVLDLQHLETTERETVLQQQVQQEAITPFNLEIAPLIRCSLLQLDAEEYVLLLNMHHIVSDGWSMGVLIQELSSLYQAFGAGEPSPLAELPIQYADFAVWQRQWLSGEVLETQLNYWQQQLAGAPELLKLPTDRPRPSVQTYRGATQTFSLNTDLTEKLQTLSRESGTTLFMTLHAAFSTLLYRYSGQSDILIGSPIANRNRSEIESLIGFFLNTLVLRTSFEDHPSFESLLTKVRETTLKAYEHKDVPFEQVVEALQPQRSLSHSPLFQVMFVLQNAPMGEIELPGVTLSELNWESTIAKFDLTLSMTETDRGLVGSWEYNTDLFDGSTIERMAAHFQNLLSAIVENPQVSVAELPLLCEAERHQLLMEWNDTAKEYPSDKCIYQLFEEQVEKTPDAVAVVFENQQLTYQQLNQRANQLAHHLQSLGVGPEVLVGICVERSLEMVVGLLGILKAGGAYVPLDPNYPPSRLSYMLADSGVEVLLTQELLLESLPPNPAQVVCLDADWGAIEQQGQENLEIGGSSDNLAYVIYTSGSTGQPKGVLVEHQGLCNLAQAQRNLFDVEPTSRILQFASVSFDASVSEIFMALTSGGMLILATASELMPGDDLKQILHQSCVTHVTLPPSALTVLPTDELPALGQIIVAGEACPAELVHQWSVGRRFFNAYGPTESTVCATVAQISDGSEKITIGRPIANTQIYILDSHLQPVPIGVPGELYIGGDGLARGYLNRPQLTQEKFIPNPFSDSKSERLYKTGDLARYGRDGNIEFIGRIDNQVKIRGFRIELGEIEAVLSTHPEVREVVVIVREEQADNKYLVAYIVARAQSLTISELRNFLKQKLPDYMLPSFFVMLEALPLTPNGKINRRVLPATDMEENRQVEFVAPRTATEEAIAEIVASVLKLDRISIYDNFFDLGGHSLLVTQVISRLQRTFSVELPIRSLFESPNVVGLAEAVTQLKLQHTEDEEIQQLLPQEMQSSVRIPYRTNTPIWSSLIPIQSKGSKPPLFCVHGAFGNVLVYSDLAHYLSPNQPVYGLQSVGLDLGHKSHTQVEEMAAYYIKEIQTVQPQGPYLIAGWSMGGIVALEMAQQLLEQGEQISFLGLIDTYIVGAEDYQEPNGAKQLVNILAPDIDLPWQYLRQLDSDEQIIYIMEMLKQRNFLPPNFDLVQVRRLIQVYNLNARAAYSYTPKSYPDKITLFQATESELPASQAQSLSFLERLATKEVETYRVPGKHKTMFFKPHIKTLAQELQKCLEAINICGQRI